MWNVVISKKFLRTRKIMVMHNNERGECCLRTLVDRKRKRYNNAVDVVVRLHGPTDLIHPAPPSSLDIATARNPNQFVLGFVVISKKFLRTRKIM